MQPKNATINNLVLNTDRLTACRGLVTIDSRTGEVTRNDDYYVIAHASRFVRPGALRVESNQTDSSVDSVATFVCSQREALRYN